MNTPVKKRPTTMKIADLFDATARDQAVIELPDEDLIVAATITTASKPSDVNERTWAAMDIAWFALHCERASSAVTIIRQGASVLSVQDIFEQFLRVTHFRSEPEGRLSILDGRRSVTPAKVAHVLAQCHGEEVFQELLRLEAGIALSRSAKARSSWFAELVPYITDVELLRSLLGCDYVFAVRATIQRLWELGETKLVFELADSKDPAITAMTEARREANYFLMTVNPPQRTTSKTRF